LKKNATNAIPQLEHVKVYMYTVGLENGFKKRRFLRFFKKP